MDGIRGLRWVVLILIIATAAAAWSDADTTGNDRSVSPWFIYHGEDSIEDIRPRAETLKSISVLAGPPAEFVEQCHDLGVEVYLLVGGEGEDLATEAARRELIEGWLAWCGETGADGIDLDYEALEAEFHEPARALVREAAEALHGQDLSLSICVSYEMCTWQIPEEPRPGELQMRGWYDPAQIGQLCDVVRVMCYDMHSVSGSSVGPVSTRPWARDAMRFWMEHVPSEKLVMGLPTYGRDITMTMGRPTDSVYGPIPEVPEGTQLQRTWLPYEEINQYRYVDEDGVVHLFFASDAPSTRAHLFTAQELGIETIGFWRYGAVTDEQWTAVDEWLAGG